MMRQMKANKAKSESTASSGPGEVPRVFDKIRGMINDELVKSVNGVFQFTLSGAEAGDWYLDLKNGAGILSQYFYFNIFPHW